jgi:hypothetical protein
MINMEKLPLPASVTTVPLKTAYEAAVGAMEIRRQSKKTQKPIGSTALSSTVGPIDPDLIADIQNSPFLKRFHGSHRQDKLPDGLPPQTERHPEDIIQGNSLRAEHRNMKANLANDAKLKARLELGEISLLYGNDVADKNTVSRVIAEGKLTFFQRYRLRQAGRRARRLNKKISS